MFPSSLCQYDSTPPRTAIDISPRSPLPNPILDPSACPNYKIVSHTFQPDDVVVSRPKTRQLQSQLNTLTTAAEICAVLFGITMGEGTIPCAIFAAETNFYTNKAVECAGKNQCLELKWEIISRVLEVPTAASQPMEAYCVDGAHDWLQACHFTITT